MGLRGRTPETGPRGLTFTHDKCHGKQRQGWLSGDVHVLEMHVGKGKSKPCERVLLGSNAPCAGCGAGRALDSIGYVPLRDATGRPTCVLVRKARIAFVANLERGSTVYYGKEEGDFESVYVVPAFKEMPWKRYFSCDPTDDMSYWLPLFLGVPHLASVIRELFARGPECQPTVTEQKPVAAPVVESLPPTVGELTQEFNEEEAAARLAYSHRRLDAKKARERANEEWVRKNGKP